MAVKRYDGSAWQTVAGLGAQGAAATSSSIATWVKTASGGETSLSGNDDNSQSLSYTVGQELVFINGTLLKRGSDYTATNGTSITGLTALAANDVATVWTVNAFSVTNAISNTLVDAKGDLIVATAADTPARLAVGSNDQVLTADSTTATGLKWAAASTSNKTFTLLNSGGTALSGSSSVVINVTTKEDYYILVVGASCGSRQDLDMRINGDTGANYNKTQFEIAAESTYSANNFISRGDVSTSTSLRLATMSSNAASTMNVGIYVGAGNSTTLHPIQSQGGASASTGNAQSIYVNTAIYSGSAAITSFTFFAGANFDAGTVYVYGA